MQSRGQEYSSCVRSACFRPSLPCTCHVTRRQLEARRSRITRCVFDFRDMFSYGLPPSGETGALNQEGIPDPLSSNTSAQSSTPEVPFSSARQVKRSNCASHLHWRNIFFCARLKYCTRLSVQQLVIFICVALTVPVLWVSTPVNTQLSQPYPVLGYALTSTYDIRHPVEAARRASLEQPETWLRENSQDAHSVNRQGLWHGPKQLLYPSSRPRAALISLVRNEELAGIMQSMRQLEFHWNHKYQYPWIFFNEKPFSDEFKASVMSIASTLVSGTCS